MQEEEEYPGYQVKRRKPNESVEKSQEKSNQEIKPRFMEKTGENNVYGSMWAAVKGLLNLK